MENFEEVLKSYGWVAVLTVIILRETFPMVWKSLFPAYARKKQLERESIQTERDYQRKIAQDEISHRRAVELRQIAAFEQIANNTEATRRVMEGIQVFLNSLNERIERIDERTDKNTEILATLQERMPKHTEVKTTPTRRRSSRNEPPLS